MATLAKSAVTTSSHKDAAITFLRLASSGDVRRAFDSFAAPNFRHHNPYFRGDAKSLAIGMEENATQNPDKKIRTVQAIEEGDLVVVHSRVCLRAEAPEFAVVHIFRFEGDRVAELWDLGQEVSTDSPNEFGMF
jgi:predicted SnoaL-like aldol condensation-catalyzing enzyme